MAPDSASAEDQTRRLIMAENAGYDVIGVDVADEEITYHLSWMRWLTKAQRS